MLYLLDANTLIDAKRDYFQFGRVPEFWSWLEHQGSIGNVKIPVEIYDEFHETRRPNGSRDELAEWADSAPVKQSLLLDEEIAPSVVREVIDRGYCDDPTDEEVGKMGKDPFLIAYALMDQPNRVVVTTETSKPRARRANRRIPDVCKTLGIRPLDTFGLLVELNFTTDWRDR